MSVSDLETQVNNQSWRLWPGKEMKVIMPVPFGKKCPSCLCKYQTFPLRGKNCEVLASTLGCNGKWHTYAIRVIQSIAI